MRSSTYLYYFVHSVLLVTVIAEARTALTSYLQELRGKVITVITTDNLQHKVAVCDKYL